MRYFIIIILLLTCSINIFPQNINKLFFDSDESYYYFKKIEKDINASLRFIYPPPNENSFGYIDFSLGISYGIIPEFYYIGIAGDIALGFDWFGLFSNDNKEQDDDKNNDEKIYQIGLSIGARIYNLLQIYNFKICSFIGCDFLYIILPMPYVGIEFSYKMFGLGYAYYLPIYKEFSTNHQISIKFYLSIN